MHVACRPKNDVLRRGFDSIVPVVAFLDCATRDLQ